MNQLEKLRRFTDAIEMDARAESDMLLADARREVKRALSAAEDEVLNETYRFIKDEVARERAAVGRDVSRRMMENKNRLNARREEMGGVIMRRVVERLEEYVKTEEYFDYLTKTALDIINEFAHADTVLYLRPDDMPLAPRLRERLKDERFTTLEGQFKIGGIMGACPAAHIQIDASFDTKLSELTGHFAEMFGLRLSQ